MSVDSPQCNAWSATAWSRHVDWPRQNAKVGDVEWPAESGAIMLSGGACGHKHGLVFTVVRSAPSMSAQATFLGQARVPLVQSLHYSAAGTRHYRRGGGPAGRFTLPLDGMGGNIARGCDGKVLRMDGEDDRPSEEASVEVSILRLPIGSSCVAGAVLVSSTSPHQWHKRACVLGRGRLRVYRLADASVLLDFPVAGPAAATRVQRAGSVVRVTLVGAKKQRRRTTMSPEAGYVELRFGGGPEARKWAGALGVAD